MEQNELKDLIWCYYLDDSNINSSPEYLVVVEKIEKLLLGKKVGVKPSLDRLTILGWDSIILFVKLQNSGSKLVRHLIELEEYELCARLRDLDGTIKSYLYDFEE